MSYYGIISGKSSGIVPVMSHDAITTCRNSVSTTDMSYYGIISGRGCGIDTGNEL